jgi:tetratricopeptide (TPR) repeat protein
MFVQQGGTAASAHDRARELSHLRQAIRRNPAVESNYMDLGSLLLRAGNFSEAAIVLDAARSRFPNNAQAALSAGVAYHRLQRFSESVAAFLDAGHLDPDAEQPIAFLDSLADSWGDRKADVVALFTLYAKRHPRSALAHLALGRATADADVLRTAVELNAKSAEAYFELGLALEANKHFPAAAEAFQRAAELDPRDPVPHYRLARLYARTGNSSKAMAENGLHDKLAIQEKARLHARHSGTKHVKLALQP